MRGLLAPLVFFAVGAGVLVYNATHDGTVITFPYVERLVPASTGDSRMQGRLSGVGLLLVGGVLFLSATRRLGRQVS